MSSDLISPSPSPKVRISAADLDICVPKYYQQTFGAYTEVNMKESFNCSGWGMFKGFIDHTFLMATHRYGMSNTHHEQRLSDGIFDVPFNPSLSTRPFCCEALPHPSHPWALEGSSMQGLCHRWDSPWRSQHTCQPTKEAVSCPVLKCWQDLEYDTIGSFHGVPLKIWGVVKLSACDCSARIPQGSITSSQLHPPSTLLELFLPPASPDHSMVIGLGTGSQQFSRPLWTVLAVEDKWVGGKQPCCTGLTVGFKGSRWQSITSSRFILEASIGHVWRLEGIRL